MRLHAGCYDCCGRTSTVKPSYAGWMFGGIIPVWLWMTVFVLILAVGFVARFRSGRWKSIVLIETAPVIIPPRIGADALTVAE